MYQDKPEWIAHQRKHWIKANAQLWLRRDADRFMTSEVRKSLLPDPARSQPPTAAHANAIDLAAEREWLRRMRFDVAKLTAEIKFRRFFDSLKAGFKPSQPRWPKGNGRISGRWSRGAGTSTTASGQDASPTRGGHHLVPKAIFNDPTYNLPSEARAVFERGVTGRLNAGHIVGAGNMISIMTQSESTSTNSFGRMESRRTR